MASSPNQTVPIPGDANFHELAHLFPMMSRTAHKELVADIKQHGLLHPLTSYEGKIIDGRNRFLACQEAGIEPRIEELTPGVDPLDFVVSTNYTRRHLSESQRALAGARIVGHAIEQAAACKLFKISSAAIKHAEYVLRHATPDLISAVEQDSIPVNVAAKLASMPEEAQDEACTLKVKELRGLIKQQTRIKKTVRLAKATKLASEQLSQSVYNVIYADPPWTFEVWSKNGMDRSAENHYPTMTTEAICEMPVPAAADAVLFLWVTTPNLLAGLDVLKAWGFEYRSQFVWVKDRSATGYWNRSKHELLLVGVKGNIPAPDPSERVDSVFTEPYDGHSVKPEVVRQMIEDAFPTLPKIELFARKRHPGWDSHGNELDDESENTDNQVDTAEYHEQPAA